MEIGGAWTEREEGQRMLKERSAGSDKMERGKRVVGENWLLRLVV